MCRPTYFRIAYEINPWMRLARQASHARAQRQWMQLYQALTRHAGARVTLLPPLARQPDLVFTANAGLVRGRTLIRSNFRYPERQGEEPHIERWFRSHGYRVHALPRGLRFEGEGDALWLGDRLIVGYHFRSDVHAHRAIGRLLRCEVLSLELRDPKFYHLDTCFCPLTATSALYYPGAFDRYARAVLKRTVDDPLVVSRAEALRFVCNAIPVGQWLIVPRGLMRSTQRALRDRGWRLVELEFSEFLKAGGAAKCLVLRLRISPSAGRLD